MSVCESIYRNIFRNQRRKGAVALAIYDEPHEDGTGTHKVVAIGWSLCHYRDSYRITSSDENNPASESYLIGERLKKYRIPLSKLQNIEDFLKECKVPDTVRNELISIFTELAVHQLLRRIRMNSGSGNDEIQLAWSGVQEGDGHEIAYG